MPKQSSFISWHALAIFTCIHFVLFLSLSLHTHSHTQSFIRIIPTYSLFFCKRLLECRINYFSKENIRIHTDRPCHLSSYQYLTFGYWEDRSQEYITRLTILFLSHWELKWKTLLEPCTNWKYSEKKICLEKILFFPWKRYQYYQYFVLFLLLFFLIRDYMGLSQNQSVTNMLIF